MPIIDCFPWWPLFEGERRRWVTVLMMVVVSATTLTVVHKCVVTDTLQLQTTPSGQDSARAGRGRVVATAQLVLPERDTVVVHDTIRTVRVVVSRVAAVAGGRQGPPQPPPPLPPPVAVARTAVFRDSTFAGVIRGVVTAPPDTAPLGIRYQLTRPRFAPTVTFLEDGSRPVAVVAWRGEQVQLRDVRIPIVRPPRTFRVMSLEYDPVDGMMIGRLTGGVAVGSSMRFTLSVEQRAGLGQGVLRRPTLMVGVRKML